jgi:hypothetical protein
MVTRVGCAYVESRREIVKFLSAPVVAIPIGTEVDNIKVTLQNMFPLSQLGVGFGREG